MIKMPFSIFLLTCFYTAHAFADNEGYEKTSGGLPQLDPSSYPSQIFWMVVIFAIMHFYFSKKSLPQIARTVENRSERIKNDLDSAERLRTEVEEVQRQYEEKLEQAKTKSSDLFKNIESDIKVQSENALSDFQNSSEERVTQLEKNISIARQKAMDEISDVIEDIATSAAEKIIDTKIDQKSAKNVIKKLNKVA